MTGDVDATPPAGIPRVDATARADRGTAPSDRYEPVPGRLLAGRYEVRDTLATGGEGAVLVAHDRELDLEVVVKTRRVDSAADLDELRRETGLLMRVSPHPGLPVVRSDAVDGDHYLMISDRVAGRDLRDLAAAQTSPGLPLATVLDLVDRLADTLDHLHRHQPPVVHGDVKPENVIIPPGGHPVLVDFGASMRVGDDRERLGTVGFSAPEVLAGEAVSASSDVFSLAALTVYLLTGITPRPGAPWPAAMADGRLARLERVLRRGLTWDPLGRPWSASAFANELRSTAEDELPTGTITLLVVSAGGAADSLPRALLDALDLGDGQRVDSARVPAGTAVHVYSRAGDAAQAALDAERAAQASHTPVRIALHAGDLGGRQGATVQLLADETLELASRRPDAGVVCSHTVRMLLGSVPGLEFHRVGPDGAELRVVAAATSAATDRSDRDGAVVAIASDRADTWIASRRASPMTGRAHELSEASVAVDRQRAAAAAAMVLVRGDAGMGKTRFLAELAARARSAGELVLVGRCSQSGGAFEAFLDALGDDAFPFEQGQLERDEEGWVDRRRFFGRIAATLAGQGRAVTLVLDDVQWIDGSSTALLSQLLDDVGPQLAVIAGCRPDADPRLVDELTVRPGSASLTMGPISDDDFATMAAAHGVDADRSRLDELHALTAGSPFFASQLLEHLRRAPTGDGDEAASGIRGWIRQRAERLGDDTAALLATAATIGRRFDLIVLADVVGASPLEVVGILDRALDAGLVAETAQPGEFGFVHDIVRAELASSLSGTRRGLLHAAIGRRLEEAGDDLERLESSLHHWLAAGRLGDPLHAGEVAARVGTLTTERLAHERAIDVLERALAVVDGAAAGGDRDRVEAHVRVALGRARFLATDSKAALDELRLAADLAQRADDGETLAQAALVASLNRRHGRDDPELLDLLARASDRCPPEPAVLPAMLHIRRSRLLPLSVPHEQRSDMARRGLEHLDRMEAVDRAMVETEVARACWRPGDADERLSVTTRVIETAARARERGPSRWTGVTIEALNIRWATLVQLGRLHDGLDDATTAVSMADAAGSTFLLSRSLMGEAMIRAALGDHETAEARSSDALAISDRHNLRLDSMAIAYCIGRDRGGQAELAALETALGDLVDSNALFVAAFALVHAEAGNLDDARRLLDDLDRRAPWPDNWIWQATAISALETAVIVGDHERARRLAQQLTPSSGHWAVAAAELGCWGPIDRVLGLAAALDGDRERARQLLIAARDSALANHATHWLARCHAGLAALAGDTPSDPTR